MVGRTIAQTRTDYVCPMRGYRGRSIDGSIRPAIAVLERDGARQGRVLHRTDECFIAVGDGEHGVGVVEIGELRLNRPDKGGAG